MPVRPIAAPTAAVNRTARAGDKARDERRSAGSHRNTISDSHTGKGAVLVPKANSP